jgi:hypothetical protein
MSPSDRPRSRWLTAKSALLLAAVLAMVGFYAGIREEKSNASATSGGAASAVSHPRSSSTRTGSSTGTSPPGFDSTGAGATGGTDGTVVKIQGDTVYVRESSGETIKVKLLASTTLTKALTVGGNTIHPGDSVGIDGTIGKTGTIRATSVTDSGGTSTTTETSSASAG